MHPDARGARTNGAALACPRCSLPLFARQAGGVTLHACGRCGGVWLAPACAERIARALPAEALALAGQATAAARAAVETAPLLACPACRTPMRRTAVRAAGLELDACPPHGTWYDRTELERVARSVAGASFRGADRDAGRSAGGRGGLSAGRAGGIAVAAGGAALGAGLLAADPTVRDAANERASALEVGETALDVADVAADVASDLVVEGVLEGALGLVGGILGALFD